MTASYRYRRVQVIAIARESLAMDDLLKQILGAQGSTASNTRKTTKTSKSTKSTRTSTSNQGGSILGDVLGGLLGGSGGGAGGAIGGSGGFAGMLPVLLPLLLQMFGGSGSGQTGMHKLLDGMHANGLGDIADSWVSGAPAKSITPAQAKKIVGPEKVKELSAQSGLPANEVAQGLSALLPNLVNHLTPNGQVPPAGQVQSAITGILGSLGL
jgi:uncharacterized protein YidB (DUF937 family)